MKQKEAIETEWGPERTARVYDGKGGVVYTTYRVSKDPEVKAEAKKKVE